jgi:hypothetical protein
MHCKISNSFLNIANDWSIFQDSILYSKYISGNVTLEYFGIKNIELFKKQHSRKFFTIMPTSIRYVKITGTGILHPHIDHNTLTTLNYYISAGEDQTIFYKPNSTDIISTAYPGKEESNIYKLDSLRQVDKFVSNSNDAYLLDVSQIHSVIKSNPKPRIFIAYLWSSHSFNQILEDINNI